MWLVATILYTVALKSIINSVINKIKFALFMLRTRKKAAELTLERDL